MQVRYRMVTFDSLTSTGAIRSAVLITPGSLVTSIGNDLRLFARNEGCWYEAARHPFSRFGGSASGITVLGLEPKRSLQHESSRISFGRRSSQLISDHNIFEDRDGFLISAFGVRKVRFFLSLDSAGSPSQTSTLFPIGSCHAVDDLVLDVKVIPIKQEAGGSGVYDSRNAQECTGSSHDLISSRFQGQRLLAVIGFAHNYVDICELTSDQFVPLVRNECSIRSLLYSLEVFLSNDDNRIEIAAGTVESRVCQVCSNLFRTGANSVSQYNTMSQYPFSSHAALDSTVKAHISFLSDFVLAL